MSFPGAVTIPALRTACSNTAMVTQQVNVPVSWSLFQKLAV